MNIAFGRNTSNNNNNVLLLHYVKIFNLSLFYLNVIAYYADVRVSKANNKTNILPQGRIDLLLGKITLQNQERHKTSVCTA